GAQQRDRSRRVGAAAALGENDRRGRLDSGAPAVRAGRRKGGRAETQGRRRQGGKVGRSEGWKVGGSQERSQTMVVVVTGASAGVGRATVRAFAQAGADLGLIARGVDWLEAARREVEAVGRRAVIAPADVADHAQVEAAAERVERQLGPIDVWVNNAMASVLSPIVEMTPEDFRRVT